MGQRDVHTSFPRQKFMETIGAELCTIEVGEVGIAIDYTEHLSQQHGFMHGGVIASVLDSACGYAALSAMPDGSEVLTVEFKINFLAPSKPGRLICRGNVIKSGRTLTIVEGEASLCETDTIVAKMQATMMRVAKKEDQ